MVHEGTSTLSGLRALDMATGESLWVMSTPRFTPQSCGATVLTSSDLVVACECTVTGGEAMKRLPDSKKSDAVCMYSIKPKNGKLAWEAVISGGRDPAAVAGGEETGDRLPPGALQYGQQPTVMADSLIVALHRSIVSVQRRPSLLPGPDGRKGGEVLWRLPMEPGAVVEGWTRVELHAGILLVRVSSDREEEGEGGSFQSGAEDGRKIFALSPTSGQV